MNRIARLVIWIGSKCNKAEIIQIMHGLQEVIAIRNLKVKPKMTFRKCILTTEIFMLILYLPTSSKGSIPCHAALLKSLPYP